MAVSLVCHVLMIRYTRLVSILKSEELPAPIAAKDEFIKIICS
jgi:hypothetical protein